MPSNLSIAYIDYKVVRRNHKWPAQYLQAHVLGTLFTLVIATTNLLVQLETHGKNLD